MINVASDLDELLSHFNEHAVVQDSSDLEMIAVLKQIKAIIKPLKPKKDYHDLIWKFWIPLPCGEFQDYFDKSVEHEEIKPDDLEELKFEWEYQYPEKMKWYHLFLSKDEEDKRFHLSFSDFYIMLKGGDNLEMIPHSINEQKKILDFISEQLPLIVERIVQDPKAYQGYIEKELSKRYRFGRIKRIDYWNADNEVKRLDEELGKSNIERLTDVLPKLIEGGVIDKVTADDFFKYCAIGYAANHYETLADNLSPKEQYKRMADMRDEGLTKIESDSPVAFHDWYHSDRLGGHPWEICRGGNSTHIDLFVCPVNDDLHNNQWELLLKGSSRVRVVETIKMALALEEHGVPVRLVNAEALLHMVTGEDYINLSITLA